VERTREILSLVFYIRLVNIALFVLGVFRCECVQVSPCISRTGRQLLHRNVLSCQETWAWQTERPQLVWSISCRRLLHCTISPRQVRDVQVIISPPRRNDSFPSGLCLTADVIYLLHAKAATAFSAS